jgi:hypothetical protein
MPVRASVEELPQPGHAILLLSELDAHPEGLALSIQRQQGPDAHLADDGWRRTEAWLLPEHVERRGELLEFHLGPEICDRLAGIATIRVRVKEPDIGVVGTTVVAWPAMLTSGAVDPSSRAFDDTVRLRRAPVAPLPEPEPVIELPPEPVPEPPAPPFVPPPRPDLRAERDIDPPKRSGRTAWMIAALVLLAVAGGGYHVYTTYFQKPAPETATAPPPTPPAPVPSVAAAPPKSVRDVVEEYFATKPTPEAMLAKARDYAKANEMAAAFLVFRHAAEAGNVPAEIEMAAFYDPMINPSRGGFTPDAARAADWYERAAVAGSAEAQRKLGLLLAKGGANLPVDAGKAKSWLQLAATQNDADAKKVLDALPK